MSTTAATIARTAFTNIGVLGAGQTMTASMSQDGFTFLNLMMSSLSIQPASIPVVMREVFDMTSGKGSPTNPYTIGIGGNLNTQRPPTQNSIVGAALIFTTSDPVVEQPLTILSDQAYQQLQVKDLTNSLPTGLWYNATYETTGFGKIYLWPVPNVAYNDLVLYLRKAISSFADQTTSYELPPGLEDALVDGLSVRLCRPYSVPISPDLAQAARTSMSIYKRGNSKLFDLPQDPATTNSHSAYYNIYSGNG